METGVPSGDLPEREAFVGEARAGPGVGVHGGDFSDGVDELAAPAHELLVVLLARDAAPALRERLRWGERAEAVEADPGAERRRCACVPLPCLGESGGGVVVRADARDGVTEVGQAGGERVGLLAGDGREIQGTGRGALVEGGADLATWLQSAEYRG